MSDYLTKNLKYLMHKKDVNAYQIQASTNRSITQSTTQRILSGATLNASRNTIKKYSDFFNVDVEQLVYKDLSADDFVNIGGNPNRENIRIKMFNAFASCGNGYENQNGEIEIIDLSFRKDWFRSEGLPSDGKDLIVIKANGDSLIGKINDGSAVLVNLQENDCNKLINGKFYVFQNGSDFICKQVRKNMDGTITLISTNTDKTIYPDIDITQDKFPDVKIFGRARWVATTL